MFKNTSFIVLIVVTICSLVFYAIEKVNIKWDVTQDQRHSLSQGSRDLLKSLDKSVKIRFYLSRSDNLLPVRLRHYAERIDSLLNSIVSSANGKVIIERLDPKINPDALESAKLDGIEPQTLSPEAAFYMGLSFSSANQRSELPYLDPSLDAALEYQILSRIRKVAKRDTTKLGLITSLPITSGEGWQIVRDLNANYEVVAIKGSEEIPEDIESLLIVHPRNISGNFNRKIDSFTKRGGSMIVLMDSVSLALNFLSSAKYEETTSDWPGLILATGMDFTAEKAVLDMIYSTKLDRGQGVEDLNAFLTISGEAIHANHPITEGMTSLSLPLTGAFVGQPHAGLKSTPIIQSTVQSSLSDKKSLLMDSKEELARKRSSFQADPDRYNIAVLLEGPLHSFADGKQRPDAKSSKVVLVGDADFIADPYSGYRQEIQGNEVFTPINNNLSFIYNSLDYLKDDSFLNDARAKSRQKRPLTKLREEERDIRTLYEKQLVGLNEKIEKLNQSNDRLNFERNEESQKQKIDLKIQQKKLQLDAQTREVKAELAAVNRTVKEEVQRMKSKIQWLTILVVPFTLFFGGLLFWIVRKSHTRVRKTNTAH